MLRGGHVRLRDADPSGLAGHGLHVDGAGAGHTRDLSRRPTAPLDAACALLRPAGSFSRAYLHHLFKCSEPLGPRLLTMHNLHYYLS